MTRVDPTFVAAMKARHPDRPWIDEEDGHDSFGVIMRAAVLAKLFTGHPLLTRPE